MNVVIIFVHIYMKKTFLYVSFIHRIKELHTQLYITSMKKKNKCNRLLAWKILTFSIYRNKELYSTQKLMLQNLLLRKEMESEGKRYTTRCDYNHSARQHKKRWDRKQWYSKDCIRLFNTRYRSVLLMEAYFF